MSHIIKSTEQTNPNDVIINQNEHQMAMDTLTGRTASINAMENGENYLPFFLIFFGFIEKKKKIIIRNSNENGGNRMSDDITIYNGKMHVISIGNVKKIENDINKI